MEDPLQPPAAAVRGERILKGLAASRGGAVGPVFVLARAIFPGSVSEYTIGESRINSEIARFEEARKATRSQIEALNGEVAFHAPEMENAVFEGHLMLLDDELLRNGIVSRIRDGRMNAEAAVYRCILHFRAVFERMADKYMRERVVDLDDIGRRLVNNLTGGADPARFGAIREPSIIIAEDLTPSDTVSLPKGLVLGFATDRGSVTSHVSLLARALGIPAVVGLGNATSVIEPGMIAAIDGDKGELAANPSPAYADSVLERERRRAAEDGVRSATSRGPAVLAGGGTVNLLANIHDGIPLVNIESYGSCGVGLYRSEYLWLNGATEPTEDDQAAAYSKVSRYVTAAVSPEATTVIRVLDIGGDKLMPGYAPDEANPFLGNRSVRFLLKNPSILRAQLRAVLRASAAGRTAVMYPMVATVEELREMNAELRSAMERLAFAGIPFDPHIKRGVMIELPSAALNAAAFAREADFFSIGTNDLVQYTMGADRGNEAVAYLYQPVNPAVLKLVDMAVKAADDAGIPVTVCGESASDPVIAAVWVALGADELSMSCSYIPVIRHSLSALPEGALDELAALVKSMWESASAAEIYEAVRSFLVSRVSNPALRSLYEVPLT